MEQRRECARIDHEPGRRAVYRAVDIEVVAIADPNRHLAEATILHTRGAPASIRINFQNQRLRLAIEDRFGGKENVGAENSIDLLLAKHSRGVTGSAKIDNDDRFVQQVERAEAKVMRDGHIVKCAVDLETRGQFRSAGNSA